MYGYLHAQKETGIHGDTSNFYWNGSKNYDYTGKYPEILG